MTAGKMEDVPKPFTEHLEELRRRLLFSIVAVGVGTAGGFYFVDRILIFLARPVGHFIFLRATEAFFAQLKVALAFGVLLSMPVILLQGWKFVLVALKPVERKSLYWILPASYCLFLGGFSFGFFLLVPMGVKFLLSYSSGVLIPQISIEEYINFVGVISLVLGAVFQMPLISYFLSKFGLLEVETLSDKRRMLVLLIYGLSALLTPGPDPVTALLLAVTSYLLFECSVLTAKWARKNGDRLLR